MSPHCLLPCFTFITSIVTLSFKYAVIYPHYVMLLCCYTMLLFVSLLLCMVFSYYILLDLPLYYMRAWCNMNKYSNVRSVMHQTLFWPSLFLFLAIPLDWLYMDLILPFKIGDLIEAKSFVDGFKGAWFRSKVGQLFLFRFVWFEFSNLVSK